MLTRRPNGSRTKKRVTPAALCREAAQLMAQRPGHIRFPTLRPAAFGVRQVVDLY
jgi:hypothetical protein